MKLHWYKRSTYCQTDFIHSASSLMNMWKKLVLSLVSLSLLIDYVSASVNTTVCFFDRGEKLVKEFGQLTYENCTIKGDTNSTSQPDDDDCNISCDKNFRLGSEKVKFELSVGEGRDDSEEIIVLNVTISNITFRKLRVCHQNLASGNGEIYWQIIEFDEDQIPEKLFMFSSVWESHRTKIQFFAEEREYTFFKEYHFLPTSTLDADEDSQIFAYVDTTFQDKVYLHVQPHTDISRYEVEFEHVDKKLKINFIPPAFNLSADNLLHEQTNFPENGHYRFSLLPVYSDGRNCTAISVATFCMQSSCETLFKMKLGLVVMAVLLILFAIIVGVLFKTIGRRKLENPPRLLLVHASTHDAHIDVVISLARFLEESCEVIPMLDELDIRKEPLKNPSYWYDRAFQMADIVLVVSSPECKNAVVTKSIYKWLTNHAQKLIQADRPHSEKEYFALLLPYCEESDLPKEAALFKRLKIEDLKKLVSNIYETKYTESKEKILNEQKLMKLIESARRCILFGETMSEPSDFENITDSILLRSNETTIDVVGRNESDEDNAASKSHNSRTDQVQYATNIESLNLLGDEITL